MRRFYLFGHPLHHSVSPPIHRAIWAALGVDDCTFENQSTHGDYGFAPAASDTDYQEVIYRERDRGDLTGLALLAAAATGAVFVIVRTLRVRGRRQAR